MQTIINSLPGYRVNEYLLVLNPHEDLRDRIVSVKKEFYQKYKIETAIAGKPHITLVSFIQYAMKEERLINRLKTVAMGHTPFKVELKDYGSFPSHTIYIKVNSKPAVQGLVKEVRTANLLMKLNSDNTPHYIMEPHLTVARKLKPWQYEKGWLEYSSKNFTGRFIADSMTLLSKPLGENRFQVVQKFEFQNMPVSTKQGELFG